MSPAPIALFAYNRPTHLGRTLEALRKNDLASQTDLHIFSDGPKSDKDVPLVEAVRASLRDVPGFKSVTVIPRAGNVGLANSIIQGVTDVCDRSGRVIVLEDDMVTSPWFLRYINDGLKTYESALEVISIHGWVYPIPAELPETFFLRGADCWGWATWARGWRLFNPDGAALLAQLEQRGLTQSFDFDGAYGYTEMLRSQIAGSNNSWAIRWHASAFLADKLTLYPGRSLVQNIGLDASGTHCGSSEEFTTLLTSQPVAINRQRIKEDTSARRQIADHLRGGPPPERKSWWSQLFKRTPAAST
ncbi:MAG: glycosyltransferase family A protein [Verrucomicrobiota bacterium]